MSKLHYKKGYKYISDKQYHQHISIRPQKSISNSFISISPDGQLVIKRCYAWDGASGPTVDTSSSMRPSIVHDALYQLIREGLLPEKYRDEADKIFYDMCIEDGMWKFRAKYWHYCMKKGYSMFKKSLEKKAKKVYIAP